MKVELNRNALKACHLSMTTSSTLGINPLYPHLLVGASPDGFHFLSLLVIEIKCLYSLHDCNPREIGEILFCITVVNLSHTLRQCIVLFGSFTTTFTIQDCHPYHKIALK